MHFNIKSGQSGIIAIILMVGVLIVAAMGMIYVVSQWDTHIETVSNDSINLTGLNYSTEIAEATTGSAHAFANVMPWLIFLGFIFFIVAFITLLAITLRKH